MIRLCDNTVVFMPSFLGSAADAGVVTLFASTLKAFAFVRQLVGLALRGVVAFFGLLFTLVDLISRFVHFLHAVCLQEVQLRPSS